MANGWSTGLMAKQAFKFSKQDSINPDFGIFNESTYLATLAVGDCGLRMVARSYDQIQAVHDKLKSIGGGTLVLDPRAIYLASSNSPTIEIDATFVSIAFNRAKVDITALPDQAVAFDFYSSATTIGTTYALRDFSNLWITAGTTGDQKTTGPIALRFDATLNNSSVRIQLINPRITGCFVACSFKSRAYFVRMFNPHFTRNRHALLSEAGAEDFAEKITLVNAVLDNNWSQITDIGGQLWTFIGGSIDYHTGFMFQLSAGSKVYMTSTHVEWNYGYDIGQTNCPITMTGGGAGVFMRGGSLIYKGSAPVVFTTALSAAVSGTLLTPWSLSTGSHQVEFSDGSIRSVTLTKGATGATWVGAVTANASAKTSLNSKYPAFVSGDSTSQKAVFHVDKIEGMGRQNNSSDLFDTFAIATNSAEYFVELDCHPDGTSKDDVPSVLFISEAYGCGGQLRNGIDNPYQELAHRTSTTGTATISSVNVDENSVTRKSGKNMLKITGQGKVTISLPYCEANKRHGWSFFTSTSANFAGAVTIKERQTGFAPQFNGSAVIWASDTRGAQYSPLTVNISTPSTSWVARSWKDCNTSFYPSRRQNVGGVILVEIDTTGMTAGALYLSHIAYDLL